MVRDVNSPAPQVVEALSIEDLADLLRHKREAAGVSQETLSGALGFDEQRIHRLENKRGLKPITDYFATIEWLGKRLGFRLEVTLRPTEETRADGVNPHAVGA